MSEWIHTELKNLTTKIGSGATPRGGQEAYKSEGISLIRSQNILDFSFSTNGLAFIDDEQARQLQNVEIKEKDVLINITGDSVARVCMVPSKTLPARVNQHVAILRADTKKLDPDYLLYYLLNPVIKRHLLRLSSDGATRNALTKANLEELIISAPKDINQQREIAEKIKLLDSKISLLRQQNQTLEELAQTLFKRWFVDFEFPDENGQPYKSSGGKMIESELGEIPEGWRVGYIYDVLNVQFGFPFKSSLFNEDEIGNPLIRIRDLKKGKTGFFTTEPFKDEYVVRCGDIVAGMDAEFRPFIWSGEDGLLNQRVCRFLPIKDYSEVFIFEFIKPYLDFFEKTKGATTVIHLGKSDLDSIEALIPDEKIIMLFSQNVCSIHKTLIVNHNEIRTLTKLRDTLLPKLMSGEMKIKESL